MVDCTPEVFSLSRDDYDLVNTSVSGATFEPPKCSKCGDEGLHVCIPLVAQKLLDDKEFIHIMARKIFGTRPIFCHFCGKSEKDVKHFIMGPSNICDDCVVLCGEVIAERKGKCQK